MYTYKINIFFIVSIFLLSGFELTGQNVDQLLEVAFRQNPQLKAVMADYEAAKSTAGEVDQLPDPTVGIGIPVLQPETRLGAQAIMISASQMFPWFGTLDAKRNLALSMSQPKYQKIAAIRLQLIHQIKTAYYQIVFIQQKQDILRRHLPIYQSMEKIALAKVESGQGSAVDVLKVQLKVNALHTEIASLDLEKPKYFAIIREKTNADVFTDKIIQDTIEQPALLLFDMEIYEEKIRSNHPLIKALNNQIDISKQSLVINKLSGKPNWGLGLDYSMITARTDANPSNNGRDILIPKISFTLPLNRKKYEAKEQVEQHVQARIENEKESLVNTYITQLIDNKSEYDQALLNNDFLISQIDLSERSFNLLLAEYSSKGNRFDELLNLRNDVINYELKLNEVLKNTYWALFNINLLTDY